MSSSFREAYCINTVCTAHQYEIAAWRGIEDAAGIQNAIAGKLTFAGSPLVSYNCIGMSTQWSSA